MKFKVMPSGVHVLLIEKGEDVLQTINDYCREFNIFGGHVQAIGAVERVTLRYWDTQKKAYGEKEFTGGFEVTSFLGTITDEGAHVHGSIADRSFHTFGGHVGHAIANPMLEVFITPTGKLSRKMNDDVQLKLLDL